MIPAKDIIEAIKPFQDSAALEKPLLEKWQYGGSLPKREWDCRRKMLYHSDVVAAVKKHRQRRFVWWDDNSRSICILCKQPRHNIDTTSWLCWDCANDQDFGKVK